MKRAGLVWTMLATVAALGAAAAVASTPPAPAGDAACHRQTFEGDGFTVCVYRRDEHELRLVSRLGDGPVGDFRRLGVVLRKDQRRLRFAMNAGMFDHGRKAVGLLIEDGRLVHAINTREGPGNFHMLPNGVFAVDRDGRASIVESRLLAKRGVGGLRWATQSGPLLVAEGKLHPRVQPNGRSRLVRNAVGVRSPDEAVFVISDGAVSFGRLARFLRDGLGCQDGLYLDGYVSSLWSPTTGRRDGTSGLGPMVVVLARR